MKPNRWFGTFTSPSPLHEKERHLLIESSAWHSRLVAVHVLCELHDVQRIESRRMGAGVFHFGLCFDGDEHLRLLSSVCPVWPLQHQKRVRQTELKTYSSTFCPIVWNVVNSNYASSRAPGLCHCRCFAHFASHSTCVFRHKQGGERTIVSAHGEKHHIQNARHPILRRQPHRSGLAVGDAG